MRDPLTAVQWRQGFHGKVVFTNGVFDLLHRGHVELLESARRLGDALIVGVNSDASVRSLGKGPARPIVAAADRARIIAALDCVDCVLIFPQPTPLEVIAALQPDILVKGGDYVRADVVGADVVEQRGGRVEIIPLVPNYSTTRIVELLRVTP